VPFDDDLVHPWARLPRMRSRSHGTTAALLVIVALLVGGCGSTGGSARSTSTPSGPGAVEANAEVVRVVDGDTLVVGIGGGEERVRLIGIDAPESVRPDTPVECWGEEASVTTTDLLPEGTPIRLERDVEARDRFDRLLAYVHRSADGLFVNLELARLGAADSLTIEPNTAYEDQIAGAVADARRAGRGLWGACGGPHEPAP
jgi:micrococcal nuclease